MEASSDNTLIIIMILLCVFLGPVGVIIAIVLYYNKQKEKEKRLQKLKDAQEINKLLSNTLKQQKGDSSSQKSHEQ